MAATKGPPGVPGPATPAGEPVKTHAPVEPVANPARTEQLSPKPALPPPVKVRFVADPVADGAVFSFALGVAVLSNAIIGTGEISPQAPNPNAHLLSIDQDAKTLTPSSAWRAVSNVGLVSAVGFAFVDPVLSGFRDGTQAGVVDGIIYGETLSINWALTNLTKISFRRPRPSAYRAAEQNPNGSGTVNSETNSALSFFSGHASTTAAVAATATYLAFSRAPGTPRPWITLGVGGLTTLLVSYGRVRSGDHFPTDVIAGALAGIGIGVLVPHLHRSEDVKRRPVWIGAAPVKDGLLLSANGEI